MDFRPIAENENGTSTAIGGGPIMEDDGYPSVKCKFFKIFAKSFINLKLCAVLAEFDVPRQNVWMFRGSKSQNVPG